MAEISSRELRTLLRGGEDIYQVKKVLSRAKQHSGAEYKDSPGSARLGNSEKTSCKNQRWANKAKNRSWEEAEEIRENSVTQAGLPVAGYSWSN